MTEREPEVINSKLSRSFTWEGYRLQVEIYKLDDRSGWTLEVVNENGTSIVWDDLFETDQEAYDAFHSTLARDGLAAFLDDPEDDVLPQPGRLD